jgi:hypothetical protein
MDKQSVMCQKEICQQYHISAKRLKKILMFNYVPVITQIIKHRDRYLDYRERYLASDIESLFKRLNMFNRFKTGSRVNP